MVQHLASQPSGRMVTDPRLELSVASSLSDEVSIFWLVKQGKCPYRGSLRIDMDISMYHRVSHSIVW